MARDDEKQDAGDDPWAGLEAEGLPDLEANFSFSFDDEPSPTSEPEASAAIPSGGPPSAADEAGLNELLGPAADVTPVGEPPAGSADDPFADAVMTDASPAADALTSGGVEDAAIDDWLSDDDAASSVLPFDVSARAALDGDASPSSVSPESSVEIGTGGSGLSSGSSIEPIDESSRDGEPAGDADPFAALAAEETAGAPDELFVFAGESSGGDEFAEAAGSGPTESDAGGAAGLDALAAVGAAGAAAASQAIPGAAGHPAPKPKRQPPARRRQPSVVGQLVGVIFGGALAIPITLAILFWGLGKDPFGLAPKVPESLAFLLPPKFRPAAALGTDAIDLASAPSLDAVVGESGADDATSGNEPGGGGDLAGADTAMETEPPADPEPLPDEPALTDVAAVSPPPADASGDDPLMDLLDESTTSPKAPGPPPSPAPEPLDLAELDAAVAAAASALEAAAAVDDPTDPVRRRLLAKWYRALAGYAEQLVSLESLAVETGRSFEPATERAASLRTALAAHPLLLEELGLLSRDWIAYAKRPSDGLVMPATFLAARRVGPYWRSQVTLPATGKRPAEDMVVLTRTEPAVAPGDAVVVTGLAIDDDVVWAVEVQPAAGAASGFPGL